MESIRHDAALSPLLAKSLEVRALGQPLKPAPDESSKTALSDKTALDSKQLGELSALGQREVDSSNTPDVVSDLAGGAFDLADGQVLDLGLAGSSLVLADAFSDPLDKLPGGAPTFGDAANLLSEQARAAKGDRTSQASYGVTEFLDDAALVIGVAATAVGAAAAGTVAATGAAVAGAGAAGYKAARFVDEKTGAGDAVVDYMVEKDAEGEEPGLAAGPDPADDPKNDKVNESKETEKAEKTEKTEESGDPVDAGVPDETQPLPEGVREEIDYDPVAFGRWQSWVEGGLVQPGPDGTDEHLPDADSLDTFQPYGSPRQAGVIDWGPDGPPAMEPDGPLPEVIGVEDPPEGFGLGDPTGEPR